MIGADGEVIRIVGTIADVTEIKTAEERLLHDAVHDSLTGLPNRELFGDRLDAALAFASQDPRLKPTVIVLDVDRFKGINDAIGLSAGDSILLTLSRRLGRLLRPQDTLARVAGDEFAVILLSEREPDRILAFAEMIRRADRDADHLRRPRDLPHRLDRPRPATRPAPACKRDEVFKNAEIAMIQAKRNGGDRIEVFRAHMRTDRSDRLMLESDLRQALERNEMKVLFQPIVRLEDRTVAGFETMLRWDHPKLGRIPAATFMPLAEESGFIVNLGIFALERTALELAAWQRSLEVEPPIFAGLNLSSRQLLRHDLLHDVKTVLARSGVLPGSLKLEFTESLVMENPEYAAQMLTAHPRPRRRPVPRRFRHRLLGAVLPPALPVRHDQDRRNPSCARWHRQDRDPALHRPDGARAEPRHRGRGLRDRKPTPRRWPSSAANTRRAPPSASR